MMPAAALLWLLATGAPGEEYRFDVSKVEKKPYHLGGYAEVRPVLFGLDRDAALYRLRFFDWDVGKTTTEYNGALQLDGSLKGNRAGFRPRKRRLCAILPRRALPDDRLRGIPLGQALHLPGVGSGKKDPAMGHGVRLEPGRHLSLHRRRQPAAEGERSLPGGLRPDEPDAGLPLRTGQPERALRHPLLYARSDVDYQLE